LHCHPDNEHCHRRRSIDNCAALVCVECALCLIRAVVHVGKSGPSCRLNSVDINTMDTLPIRSALPRRTPVKMPAQPDLLILKLMQKLGDANPLIRRNAAGALRLQGLRAKAAIPALSILLKDQDPRVRNEAERAIDHLKLAAA
jgi:hypothetical protein